MLAPILFWILLVSSYRVADASDGVNCHTRTTPNRGTECVCPSGFELKKDTSICIDKNECLVEGVCDQICINSHGSFSCECASGYTKLSDRFCRAINDPEWEVPSLIYSGGHGMAKMRLDNGETISLYDNIRLSTFTVDYNNSRVCVIDVSKANGFFCVDVRSPLSKKITMESDATTEVVNAIMDYYSKGINYRMAKEWMSGNWYMVDDARKFVALCSSAWQLCSILIDYREVMKLVALVLDPTEGYIFVSLFSTEIVTDIERANLDGSARKMIVNHELGHITNMCVDLPARHLYWVNAQVNHIGRVNYDGTERTYVPISVPYHAIAVFENYLYVVQPRHHPAIYKLNKFNSSDVVEFYAPKQTVRNEIDQIMIYHRQVQPNVLHPCAINNGDCEHFCIPKWSSNMNPVIECLCKVGYSASGIERKKCSPNEKNQFLLYGRRNVIRGISLSHDSTLLTNNVIPPILDVAVPRSIAFHSSNQHEALYYIDYDERENVNEIKKVTSPWNKSEIVVDCVERGCLDLAVDYFGGNLYWTQTDSPAIMAASLTNFAKKLTIQLLPDDHPDSILLDCDEGDLYWSSWSFHVPGTEGYIGKSKMDGSGKTTFVSDLSKPSGLTMAFGNKIFWCDENRNLIESVEKDGSHRMVINADKVTSPYQLAFLQDILIWSERDSGLLRTKNLNTLEEKVITKERNLYAVTSVDNSFMEGELLSKFSCSNCSDLCIIIANGSSKCICGDDVPITNTNNPSSCTPLPVYMISAHPANQNCSDDDTGIECRSEKKVCASDEFHCALSGLCIPAAWECDSQVDCDGNSSSVWDNSDEHTNCSSTGHCEESECHFCPDNMLHCTVDLICISASKSCDGIIHCPSGTDEIDCPDDEISTKYSPELDDFLIPCIGDTCDLDELDKPPDDEEINDLSVNVDPCSHPNRYCDNRTICLSPDKLCNNRTDCRDGSDESPTCDVHKCDHSTCTHICHAAPEGPLCDCPSNLYLGLDNKTCDAIHRCAIWGLCSQQCNRFGHNQHECICNEGFELQSDQFTCKSTDKTLPQILFSTQNELRRFDIHSQTMIPVMHGLKNTVAVDFLRTNDSYLLFWADVSDNSIFTGNLKDNVLTDVKALMKSGLSSAEGLAVDWIGMNLYWVENSLDQIEVSLINGSFRSTLIDKDIDSPRSIALDPRKGFMFWTDWDPKSPRIERSSMTGENRFVIVRVDDETDGQWPNGLTLDYQLERVYWVDAKLHALFTSNYNGRDIRRVIKNEADLEHPYAVTVFENNVYWTDWRTKSVMTANKWNGTSARVVLKTLSQPFDVKVLHPSRQPPSSNNGCARNNGNCSHVCLIGSNDSRKCLCPRMMTLAADEQTCVDTDVFLLYSMKDEILGIDLSSSVHHSTPIVRVKTSNNVHIQMDYLADQRKVYFVDSMGKEVKAADIENSTLHDIMDTGVSSPSALAIDWISKNLYIAMNTDPVGNAKIIACNLRGEYIVNIYNDNALKVKSINSLVLQPSKGRMFWSVTKSNGMHGIVESDMNGTQTSLIPMTPISLAAFNPSLYNPIALCLDEGNDNLYWLDSRSREIYLITLKGYKLKKLSAASLSVASAITVYKNRLYYSSNNSTTSTLRSLSLEDHSDNILVLRTSGIVTSLKMYDEKVQKANKNGCWGNNGGCEHLCVPISERGFTCRYAIGYRQDTDDNAKAVGIENFIFFANNWEIRGLPMDNSTEPVLAPISYVSSALSLDFYAKEDYIYWADSDNGKITRIRRDGTRRQVIVGDDVESRDSEIERSDWLAGIAVDWVAGNLYWTDPREQSIGVSRLNGSHSRVLVYDHSRKPRAIAVDPAHALLFWSNVRVDNKQTSISFGKLSGRLFWTLVNGTNTIPINDIALDRQKGHVYWCEMNQILRIGYDGRNRTLLYHEIQSNPYGLAIYQSYIYWTDVMSGGGSVKKANITNLSRYTKLTMSLGDSVRDIEVFSAKCQPQAPKNPCGVNNGGCEQLCFYEGGENHRHVCACTHSTLASDRKSCTPYSEFLAYSRVVGIESIQINDDEVAYSAYPSIVSSTYMKNVIALTYDYRNSIIYFSDIFLETIAGIHFNGTGYRAVATHVGGVEGLIYDSFSDFLFWTSFGNATIHKLKLSSPQSKPEIVLQLPPESKPRAIDVDPCKREMYWTNWDKHHPSIQKAPYGGSDESSIQNVIDRDIRMPNALTLDHAARMIYWADAKLDRIERCTYEGKKRFALPHVRPEHVFSLAIYEEFIFWSDWKESVIIRAEKLGGENQVILRSNVQRPMGIAAIHGRRPKCVRNKCHKNNGGCDDVCEMTDDFAVTCSCKRGRYLGADGFRCYDYVRGGDTNVCNVDQFKCHTATPGFPNCISFLQICDGIVHCFDGSDEFHAYCSKQLPGMTDIGEEEEEEEEGEVEEGSDWEAVWCPADYNVTIALTPSSTADHGKMRINDKNKTCLVNHCYKEFCSQICNNGRDSYSCECVSDWPGDYQLQSDNYTCSAISFVQPWLLVTNMNRIRQVYFNGTSVEKFGELSNAVGVDYDYRTKCYYWTEVNHELTTVRRHCEHFNQSQILHRSRGNNANELAVDWIAGNLYWCDSKLGVIFVSRSDGSLQKSLIKERPLLQKPRGLALHPNRGLLFWTDWGARPYIARASMDGTNIRVLLDNSASPSTPKLLWPNALTISFETNQIFWGDAKFDYIAVANLDGSNPHVVIDKTINRRLNLEHIFSLAVFENYVYWSDWELQTIERCDKYSGHDCTTLMHMLDRPMDIRLVHPFKQPSLENGKNPCNDFTCQGLCLLNHEGGSTCVCPDRFVLAPDMSCVANCSTSEFACVNTFKCIPFWQKCDKINDCGDNSDEPSTCPLRRCNSGLYQCDDGRCIDPASVCDGVANCDSDERNCEKFDCLQGYFQCFIAEQNRTVCLQESMKCDGITKCANMQDECRNNQCMKTEFKCHSSGRCIELTKACDGDREDCSDGSDELLCGNNSTKCPETWFRCASGRCIPSSWICDGQKDCQNTGEDEPESCATKKCEPTYFKCANNKCIPGRFLCDGIDQCHDGVRSDENNPKCGDFDNGTAHSDSKICSFGTCDHKCLEIITSGNDTHICQCGNGFERHGSACKATGDVALLLLAIPPNIMALSPFQSPGKDKYLDITRDEAVYSALPNRTTVTLDILYSVTGSEVLFFATNEENAFLHTMQLASNTKITTTLNKNQLNTTMRIFSLSLDWEHDLLYLLGKDSNSWTGIHVMDVRTGLRKRLIPLNSSSPKSNTVIRVSPVLKTIFWNDLGNLTHSAAIYKANLNGTNTKKLVYREIYSPRGLAVDHFGGRLYWTDSRAYTISCVRLDGTDRRLVRSLRTNMSPFKIDVFESYLYVTTESGSNDEYLLLRMNKFGVGNFTQINSFDKRITDILISHPSKQANGKKKPLGNSCNAAKPCTHHSICLDGSCVCPDGFDTYFTVSDDLLAEEFAKSACYCNPKLSGSSCEVPVNPCFGCSETLIRKDPVIADCPYKKCECYPGFIGMKCPSCNRGFGCLNGGTCSHNASTGRTDCSCPPGYSGYTCGKVDACANFCQQGSCEVDPNGRPKCICPEGYQGEQCQINVCQDFCRNDGSCEIAGGKPSCACKFPYTGTRCEVNTCSCSCTPKASGCRCQQRGCSSALCDSNYCMNNGTCHEIDGQLYCLCEENYRGKRCSLVDDDNGLDDICVSSCSNGWCLYNLLEEVKCLCQSGWSGRSCDVQDISDGWAEPTNYDDVAHHWSASWWLVTLFSLAVLSAVLVCVVLYHRQRRKFQFSHRRMEESSAIHNPLYVEGTDEEPPLEKKATTFNNPVYDSVYNDSENTTNVDSVANGEEEKKRLLRAAIELNVFGQSNSDL